MTITLHSILGYKNLLLTQATSQIYSTHNSIQRIFKCTCRQKYKLSLGWISIKRQNKESQKYSTSQLPSQKNCWQSRRKTNSRVFLVFTMNRLRKPQRKMILTSRKFNLSLWICWMESMKNKRISIKCKSLNSPTRLPQWRIQMGLCLPL